MHPALLQWLGFAPAVRTRTPRLERAVLAAVLLGVYGCGGNAEPAEPAAPPDFKVLCEGTGPVHWKSVSIFPESSAELSRAAVVWTGTEVLVWSAATRSGFRYQPDSGTVARMGVEGALSPGGWSYHAWTGKELIVWGGSGPPPSSTIAEDLADGARYDPEIDRWTPMSNEHDMDPRYSAVSAWTGTELIIWGGAAPDPKGLTNRGARYRPDLDRWTPMSTVGAPSPRFNAAAVWTGIEFIVWGGEHLVEDALRKTNTGAAYDPSTDTWRPLPMDGIPSPRSLHTMSAVNGQVVLWGGRLEGISNGLGARYFPSSDSWAPVSEAGVPTPRSNSAAVSTGRRLIVFGGMASDRVGGEIVFDDGGLYDPDADAWSPLPVECSKPRHWFDGPGAAWMDTGAFFWGGINQPTGALLVTPP